jgi:hypothetical protein
MSPELVNKFVVGVVGGWVLGDQAIQQIRGQENIKWEDMVETFV